jgi:CSLREA domain-containing protein
LRLRIARRRIGSGPPNIHARLVLAFMLGAVALPQGSAAARGDTQSIVVNEDEDELIDDGDCSLREAVRAANLNAQVDECPGGFLGGLDVIQVPAGTYTLTIPASNENSALNGDLDVLGETRIEGAGMFDTIVQAGTIGGSSSNGIERVFHVPVASIHVTFTDMTVRNGNVSSEGAGINRSATGPTTIEDLYVTGNKSGQSGGGLGLSGDLTISNSWIDNNISGLNGGGLNHNSGTLTIDASTIAGNITTASGGGIYAPYGVLTNTTISGNTAGQFGGGWSIPNSSLKAELFNVTIANNNADSNEDNVGTGGGVYQPATGVNANQKKIRNSIIADNIVGNTALPPSDCVGEWNSLGGNIIKSSTGCVLTTTNSSDQIGVDPDLLSLNENGGPTPTHALQLSSPALDAGVGTDPASGCPETDQRGVARPADSSDDDKVAECDSGAVEYPALTVKGPLDPLVEGDSGTSPAAFKVKLSSPAVVSTQFHYEIEGLNGAVAGSDFLGESGLDSIDVGSTTKVITVQIVGDTEQDANKEFIRLTVDEVGNNVSISKDSAKATILDDDPEPHPRFVDMTLKGHLRAEGKVHVLNPVPQCLAQVPVRIQRKTPDGWTKGLKVLTNDNGIYEAELEDKIGRYRARITRLVVSGPGGGHSCSNDTSDEEKHEH